MGINWKRVLFAVDSADSASGAVMDKVAQLASALTAEVELFQCVFDTNIAHSAYAVLIVKPPGFRRPVQRRSMHHVDTGAARQVPYVRELL
jgi:hypothetical protein